MNELIGVTLTGIDENTDLYQLSELSKRFPFVEWGVLISEDKTGNDPRYPSLKWIKSLENYNLNLSLHICGKWLKDFLIGDYHFLHKVPFDLFSRFQFNFKTKNEFTMYFFDMMLQLDKQFIFQFGDDRKFSIFNTEINFDEMFQSVVDYGIDAVVLYDKSGGNGILPKEWPQQRQRYTGYAGGLSAENFVQEFEKITTVNNEIDLLFPIWTDAETNLRTYEKFDLKKAEDFLTNANLFVVKWF